MMGMASSELTVMTFIVKIIALILLGTAYILAKKITKIEV